MNDTLLQFLIDEEAKKSASYITKNDEEILATFFMELNRNLGTDYHYLSELDNIHMNGAGKIVAKYIFQISSETIRSYMMWQMIEDRIPECSKILLEMYLHFKASEEYIAQPGYPSPAHIHVRYDNGFCKLKPRSIQKELVNIIRSPRDTFYLPFTTKMLASWRIPEMKDILLRYLKEDAISSDMLNLPKENELYKPSFYFIIRELRFIALGGLRYYPTEEVLQAIQRSIPNDDREIEEYSKKTISIISQKLLNTRTRSQKKDKTGCD